MERNYQHQKEVAQRILSCYGIGTTTIDTIRKSDNVAKVFSQKEVFAYLSEVKKEAVADPENAASIMKAAYDEVKDLDVQTIGGITVYIKKVA